MLAELLEDTPADVLAGFDFKAQGVWSFARPGAPPLKAQRVAGRRGSRRRRVVDTGDGQPHGAVPATGRGRHRCDRGARRVAGVRPSRAESLCRIGDSVGRAGDHRDVDAGMVRHRARLVVVGGARRVRRRAADRQRGVAEPVRQPRHGGEPAGRGAARAGGGVGVGCAVATRCRITWCAADCGRGGCGTAADPGDPGRAAPACRVGVVPGGHGDGGDRGRRCIRLRMAALGARGCDRVRVDHHHERGEADGRGRAYCAAADSGPG